MNDQSPSRILNCKQAFPLFESLVADELDSRSAVDLLQHIRSCEPCTELFDLHAELNEQEGLAPQASTDDFAEVRSEVLAHIQHSEIDPARPGNDLSFTPTSRIHGSRPTPTNRTWRMGALAAAAIVLAFATGWAGAKLHASATDLETTDLRTLWVSQLADHSGSFDSSPYEFQDVRVRPVNPSTVSLSFDVATHVEVERPSDDPLVQEALIQSIRGGSDLGGRLQAIQQTAGPATGSSGAVATRLSDRVRDALLGAMANDPSLAVRMEAQNRLSQGLRDPVVERALVEVLESEDSVQLRLLAIDTLGKWGMTESTLRNAFEQEGTRPGMALEVRAASFPNEF